MRRENGSFLDFMQLVFIKKISLKIISLTQKHKITLSGLNYLCQSLGLKTCIGIGDDKFDIFHLNTVKNLSEKKVHENIDIGKQNDYFYDIETETHDFNCGFSLIVHNTARFVLSMKTKTIIKVLENMENFIDSSNLDENHKILVRKTKKLLVNLKLKLLKIFVLTKLFVWDQKLIHLNVKVIM